MLISEFLTAVSYLDLHFGVSHPDGFLTETYVYNETFSLLAGLNYSDRTLDLDRGYFISENISIGSLSYKGFLKEHQKDKISFISIDEGSGTTIYKEGSPQNNTGVIFSLNDLMLDLSFQRAEDYSEFLIHKMFIRNNLCEFDLIQSFSLSEDTQSEDSWYYDEYLIKSAFMSHTSLALIQGDKYLFGAGQLSTNHSTADPPGYSLLMTGGYSFRGLFFQNEIKLSSPYYVTADLNIREYPLILLGKVYAENPLYHLESAMIYSRDDEPLPWRTQLWTLDSDSKFSFYLNSWKIKNGIEFSLFNEKEGDLVWYYSFDSEFHWKVDDFFTEIKGKAEFEEIYTYSISLESGISNSSFEWSFSPEVVIDKKIVLNLYGKATIYLKRSSIKAAFTIERLGLYNYDPLKIKPSVFIGMELNQITLF